MAQTVVSSRFCVPRPIDLAMTENVWQIMGRGKLVVNDVHGNLVFKVVRSFFSFDRTRLVLDANGSPILTLRKKTLSIRSKWEAFRGESTGQKYLIFSARRSSMLQMKTKLNVFLASNKSEDACDYTVQGSWFQRSCKVHVGDSSTVCAQMHKSCSLRSKFTGKDKTMVRVNPNIDYAFVIALTVILDEINSRTNPNAYKKTS